MKKIFLLSLIAMLSACAAVQDTPAAEPSAISQESSPTPSETTSVEPEDEASVEESPESDQQASSDQAESSGETEVESEPEESSTSDSDSAPTKSPTSAPEDTSDEVAPKLTLATVSANSSASSCWVVIDGLVYDLTSWISKHPGGSGAILGLCGGDGTDQFSGKHGGQAAPASALSEYLLGEIQR